MNRFKDFLYETSDLILGGVILVFMLFVVGWQLYGWFTPQDFVIDYKEPEEIVVTIPQKQDSENPQTSADEDISTPDSDVQNPNNSTSSEVPAEEQPEENTDSPIIQEESILVSFSINSGDSGYKIDSKLFELGLIKEKNSFVNRIIELKLDSKLKIGEYKIKTGSSVDDIINILTK